MKNIFEINGYVYITNEDKIIVNDIILSSFDNWTFTNKKLKPLASLLVKVTNESFFVNFLTKNKSDYEIDLRTKHLSEWEIENEKGCHHKKIIKTNNPRLIKLGVKKTET